MRRNEAIKYAKRLYKLSKDKRRNDNWECQKDLERTVDEFNITYKDIWNLEQLNK